jgi:nucleoside-diphosphate-sugar epimerase
LVIGGTGPTGPFIVGGLRRRGYAVTILHTGAHEHPDIADDVEHIHTDPYSEDALRAALGDRSFDVTVVTYGRLRRIAAVMRGRTGHFISVGGGPAYRGYMNAPLYTPAGLPVPCYEDAPLVAAPEDDAKGFRIMRTERAVFEHQPEATHFRYPYVYGPYQLLPREWPIVRRALDGRRHIIVPEDGLTLLTCGYVENLAEAILLAVDRPEAARGQIYNCGDEEVLTLRQVVEIVAHALDHEFEIVSMPWALAKPARPLVGQPFTTHRVYDLGKLRGELGYRDVVPAREAMARTACWLAEHRPEPGGVEETVLQDPFDYAAEDALIASWKKALAGMGEVGFAQEPGHTLAYSGPGGRARQSEFEE